MMLWSLSPNLPISLCPLKLTAARAFPKRIHPYPSDGIGSLCVEQLQRDYEARVRSLAVRFLVAPLLAAHLAFIRSLRCFRPASESPTFLDVRFLVAPLPFTPADG